MKTETVRMCAEMTARHQLSALGQVGEDVQQLLDELATTPDGDFTIKVSTRKPKAPAAPVVEEAPVETPVETPVENPVETPVVEATPVETPVEVPAAE
jgi:hypothetical protein